MRPQRRHRTIPNSNASPPRPAFASPLDLILDTKTNQLKRKSVVTKNELMGEMIAEVRSVETTDGVLIFDDTVQEKAWTDENELMCWQI
jgi:hypothetical protein